MRLHIFRTLLRTKHTFFSTFIRKKLAKTRSLFFKTTFLVERQKSVDNEEYLKKDSDAQEGKKRIILIIF